MVRLSLVSTVLALLPLAALAGPPVLTPAPPHAILANGDPAMSDTLTGRWTVTEVAGATILPGAPVTLEFGAEGGLAGKAGCNSFSTSLTVNGAELLLGPARATKMACGSEVMALEAAFMRALERITRYQIAADGTLALYGYETLMMRAVRE